MYKPRIEVAFGNERIISPSGLNIVGAMLGKSDFKKRCDRREVDPKRSQPQIKDGDILLTYTGLLTLGKTSYDSVNEFDDDPDYYQTVLGIAREIPSAETIRQRMDDIGDSLRSNLLDANVDMFVTHSVFPGELPGGEVPVDMDMTPFDNSRTMKEGLSRTYKGFDGYAPMVAYIGTEGFMANIELREGKQRCQAHTPEFLKETLTVSHRMTDNRC